MMNLTVEEYQFLMELIERFYGRGYSDVKPVGHLQAKLSMMAEVAAKYESCLMKP